VFVEVLERHNMHDNEAQPQQRFPSFGINAVYDPT
jgi:hypothetical protein